MGIVAGYGIQSSFVNSTGNCMAFLEHVVVGLFINTDMQSADGILQGEPVELIFSK